MSAPGTVVGIIPARMASSRFPGKPLALIHGKPMIEHVYRAAAPVFGPNLYVATCDEEIRQAAQAFRAPVLMTSSWHVRCLDRAAEAALKLDLKERDIVAVIQGDEPMLEPAMIAKVLHPLKDPSVDCVSLMASIPDVEELNDANRVKVAVRHDGNALYFSRHPIPWGPEKTVRYKQVGVLAFRNGFLQKFSRLPFSLLEGSESVDLLRALENGYPVRMAALEKSIDAVDTPEDLIHVEGRMRFLSNLQSS